MSLQWIGAACMIAGCGGIGFGMALSYKREMAALGKFLKTLEYLQSDLEFRQTPLPELFRRAEAFTAGSLGKCFGDLARELESQISPDAEHCMAAALEGNRDLPVKLVSALQEMGRSLGQFDLQGQLRGLRAVSHTCQKELAELEINRSQRLRSYQTLGLCAGAALGILLI